MGCGTFQKTPRGACQEVCVHIAPPRLPRVGQLRESLTNGSKGKALQTTGGNFFCFECPRGGAMRSPCSHVGRRHMINVLAAQVTGETRATRSEAVSGWVWWKVQQGLILVLGLLKM